MFALGAILSSLVQAPAPIERATPAPASFSRSIDSSDGDEALLARMQRAADAGLEWLAAHQSSHGYWQAHVGHKQMDDYVLLRSTEVNEALGQGHIGVTALCGMAFLAGGHLPDRGRWGEVVRRTLDYVLAHVGENGFITDGGTRMYSHAFATLFLAEIHGMCGGAEVRSALERATHIIVDCQNRQGGWRYNAFTDEADVSVTVCQLQALRAARNIGIKVPKNTIDEAVAFVMRARTPYGHSQGLFYYKNEGRGAGTKNRQYSINAAAATALFSAGVYDEALFAPVLDFLEEDYRWLVRDYASHYFFWYGNYYACQAFFQAGGARFERFQNHLAEDLMRLQRSDGRWINDCGPGDAFSTAIGSLILQVPKNYLPIFQR